MEEGVARDIVRATGETATLGAGIGTGIRAVAAKGPELIKGAAQALSTTAPSADVALGGIGGAGAVGGKEAGQEFAGDAGGVVGELVGAFLAPTVAAGGHQVFKRILSAGKDAIAGLTRSLSQMSDDGAASLLAEAMVREGLTPDDVAKKLADLGPDAIPADLGNNFARLLREASNKVPRIEALSGKVLADRQAGQSARIAAVLDDSTGTPLLNVDDELIRLNSALKPDIDEAYAAARVAGEKALFPEKPKLPSGVGAAKGKGKDAGAVVTKRKTKLERLIDGGTVSGPAKRAAAKELEAKRLSGEEVTKLDIVDAHKRALDDIIGAAIRKGEDNKARMFVKLKNQIVEETDKLVPEYKAARDIFAGKAELEKAAEFGESFLKLKHRDIIETTKNMGASERKFFKLGAKKAILDRMDNIQINADTVKRLFGKNGDVRKLRTLFDDDKSFKTFSDTLEKEANFIMTKAAAQGNSTTVKQLADAKTSQDLLTNTMAASGEPIAIVKKVGDILGGLATQKSGTAYVKALEDAGELLINKGVDSAKIIPILRKGNAEEVQRLLNAAFKKPATSKVIAPTVKAAASSVLRPEQSQ